MLNHNDIVDLRPEMERNNVVPFGLYDATVQPITVALDPRTQEIAAETLKAWFVRHHPQELQRLGHVPMDTWDRMARNRKRGYDQFLEVMGNTFQRRDVTHARSRALPDITADSHNVKWTAVLDWQKGQYHDTTSCFFSGNRVYLNGMANKGVTMLGFHDMEQGIGTGRVFVSPTFESKDHPLTPKGLLLWGGYGQLDDLGWMPVKPAADVMVAISQLPYRTDLMDNVTWLGYQQPAEEQRVALGQLPNNYNSFRQDEEPAAFECGHCKRNFPGMSARIVTSRVEHWDEDAYNKALEVENALNEEVQTLAVSNARYTPTGRQSLPWARRYQQLLTEAQTANQDRRRLGQVQITEELMCMECHYAQTLPAR